MNIERMQALKEAVLKNAQRFNMAWWGKAYHTLYPDQIEKYFLKNQDRPQCDTVLCLAGETLVSTGQAVIDKQGGLIPAGPDAGWYSACDIEGVATDALDLTEAQANNLFFLRSMGFKFGWPKEFEDRYLNATTVQERAQAAADRIQYMIDTWE